MEEILAPSTDGLTADEVAVASLRDNPELDKVAAELAQSKVDRTQARLGWLPKIQGSMRLERRSVVNTELSDDGFIVGALNEGPLVVTPCPGGGGATCVGDAGGSPVVAAGASIETLANNSLFSAEATLPISDYVLSVAPAVRAAGAEVKAHQAEHEAIKLEVQVRAREAYYAWVQARGARLVHEHSERRLERHEQDAQRSLDAGASDLRNSLLIRTELTQARAALSYARAEEESALARMAIMMGEKPETLQERPPTIGEDFRAAPKEARPGALKPRAIDKAFSHHVNAARAIRWGALASIIPRVGLTATVLHGNPHPWYFPPTADWNTTWAVGIVSSWSIDGAIRAGVTLRRRKADIALVEAQRATALRRRDIARSEVIAHERAAVEALKQTGLAREAARDLVDITHKRHAAGAVRLVVLLDVENTLVRAWLAELNASIQLRMTRLRARYISGQLEVIH